VEHPGAAADGTQPLTFRSLQQDDADDQKGQDKMDDQDRVLHPTPPDKHTPADAGVFQPGDILSHVSAFPRRFEYDRRELCGVEARSANETSIDLRLSEKFRGVVSCDTPAV